MWRWSVELKLHCILTDSGRVGFRSDLREKALKLFKAVLARSKDQWAGSLLLLVEFGQGQSTTWKAVRCDIY